VTGNLWTKGGENSLARYFKPIGRQNDALGPVEIQDSQIGNKMIQAPKGVLMDRFIITDQQWLKMEPHCLGKPSDPGRTGSDNRMVL
jgi:hypothetical protein